jgi:hypothetical protein|nr:MAG TPA: hypothetical protein [Caudoviricetes sp.]
MLRNIIINKGQFCNIILVDGELVGTFFTYEDEEDGELMISGEFFSKRYGDYKFELSYTRKKIIGGIEEINLDEYLFNLNLGGTSILNDIFNFVKDNEMS